MGFLSEVSKVSQIAQGPFALAFDDFSGRSQQEDANNQAMLSWNLMNDYNSPVKQMERLKAAGLNPLLVYGSGSVAGNTSGGPALSGGGISTGTQSMFKGLNSILNLAQGQATLDNTHAQTTASNAAAGASNAQASNLNAQASINEVRSEFERKSQLADLDYKKAITRKANEEARGASANADMVESENDLFGFVGGTKGAKAAGDAASAAGKAVGNPNVRKKAKAAGRLIFKLGKLLTVRRR